MKPKTQEVFVLIRQDVYKLTSSIVGSLNRNWDDPADHDPIRKKA